MKKYFFWTFGLLCILGLSDSIFLTYEYYTLSSIGCPISPWINCLVVTSSKYSSLFGIPLALFGAFYYLTMFVLLFKRERLYKHFFLLVSSFGVLFSIYLTYIQAFVIGLFCLYCLGSALISFLIFGLSFIFFKTEWSTLFVDSIGYIYKFILKPILFLSDAEIVHEGMVNMGEKLPRFILDIFKKIFVKKYRNLEQQISSINFKTPIGLAAGFDYDAKLTQVLPHLGFGFGTVGTVTNMEYGGNPKPMLGRLPKSKSLMVNKGFKSLGALIISKKLTKLKFIYPVGVSIGRTNSSKLINVDDSIKDIRLAFKSLDKAIYYELNISCPNLIHGNVSFYPLKNLELLLNDIDKLKLKKPIFIKMPIDQTDSYTKKMLTVISKHKITGVIFGNLQSNKKEKSFNKVELKDFKVGKFSGKPTFERSNELIKLAYKNFNNRFVIIGCGGVFNVEDAWTKFTNGATLVQLITGMIFEGPQLVAQINRDLSEKLKVNGYKNIRDIIGINTR